MKKSVKITLWVLFSVVALGVALFLSADIIVSTLVKKSASLVLFMSPISRQRIPAIIR